MKAKPGLAFHCHHDELIERIPSISAFKGRQDFIRRRKGEVELRLRLFKMIPLERMPQEGLEEFMDILEGGLLWDDTEYYEKNKEFIEALHKELCPDCPWDGRTIFTRELQGVFF